MPSLRVIMDCGIVILYTIYIHLSGSYHGVGAVLQENHTVLVDLMTPGIIHSPGFIDNNHYPNHLQITWIFHVADPGNMELYIYPQHLDLEPCCDHLIVTELFQTGYGSSLQNGQKIVYKSEGHTMENVITIGRLMQLPFIRSPGGRARVQFHTDSSGTLSGFALRYFAKSKNIVIPDRHYPTEALPVIQQLIAHGYDFSIQAPIDGRIWIQLVHMNLSVINMDTVQNIECRHSMERLEIYDYYCETDDCLLVSLCRSPYTITPVTVVSHAREVSIYIYCDQPPDIDCAILNYKLLDETDLHDCPVDMSHHWWLIEENWWVEHFFNGNSHHSDITRIWRIENEHPSGEMLFYIQENTLLRSPDCIQERVEIYMGRCMIRSNLLAYFCGGSREVYKLTNSRYAVIHFTTTPNSVSYEERRFSIFVHVGNHTDPDDPGFDDSNGRRWDSFIVITLLIVGASVFVSIVSVWARYNFAKKREKRLARIQAQNPAIPLQQQTTPITGVHRPEPPPGMPSEDRIYFGTTFDSGGIPPPAVYNPPSITYPDQFKSAPPPYTSQPPLQHIQPGEKFGQGSPTQVNVISPYPRQQYMPPPGSVPLHPPPVKKRSSDSCQLM